MTNTQTAIAGSKPATSAVPVLTTQQLQKVYKTRQGSFTAFTDINLQIHKGEVVCLLGASGCGKSSLLLTIAGLQLATEGEVQLLGERLQSPHPQVGVVFQSAALLPWLNVWQNIAFGLRLKEMPRLSATELRSRISEAISSVHLQGFERTYPHQLSGGMTQRAALARALARQPQLLLLDEPFSALDAITRLEMQKLLLEVIQQQKSTVFVVTHDIDEALLLGVRILLMSQRPGRIHREWCIPDPKPRFQHIHHLADLRLHILESLSSVMDQTTFHS